jgi:hypothetical protein
MLGWWQFFSASQRSSLLRKEKTWCSIREAALFFERRSKNKERVVALRAELICCRCS